MQEINYALIILASFIAIVSPGPATIAISGMSMSQGRRRGLALAVGVLTGSLFWSFSAAFGMGALMYANAWLFEVVRYFAACYLLYLSYKSFRSILRIRPIDPVECATVSGLKSAYIKGLLIHLSNPKAILFFGSLYSFGVPDGAELTDLIKVIATVGLISAFIFLGGALLFSMPGVRRLYFRSHSFFESLFAIFFGIAGIKMLISKTNI